VSSNRARRAEVQVAFDGADITNSVYPYLLSLTYTDSEEDEPDSLQIQLQDRDGLWLEDWLEKAVSASAASKLSMSAAIIPVNWGFGGGTLPTGRFELDGVEAGGPPSILTLKGSSLAYGSSVRQMKKTKAWGNYSLSGIASEIAGNAGLTYMYEAAYNPTYERKEQTKKSDISFLSELCHDAGIQCGRSRGAGGKAPAAAQQVQPLRIPFISFAWDQCAGCLPQRGRYPRLAGRFPAAKAPKRRPS